MALPEDFKQPRCIALLGIALVPNGILAPGFDCENASNGNLCFLKELERALDAEMSSDL